MALPDLYRGPWAREEEAVSHHCEELRNLIDYSCGGRTALFMAEPIHTLGGLIPLPQRYIPHALSEVRQAGGLYLSDEATTGFGRVGSHYWGCEMFGIKPDIISMNLQ